MELIQQRYMKQFTALDSMLSQLQTTSSYLTQQLQGLSNLANNSKS
jgi:flagellar hook-associated protein 2